MYPARQLAVLAGLGALALTACGIKRPLTYQLETSPNRPPLAAVQPAAVPIAAPAMGSPSPAPAAQAPAAQAPAIGAQAPAIGAQAQAQAPAAPAPTAQVHAAQAPAIGAQPLTPPLDDAEGSEPAPPCPRPAWAEAGPNATAAAKALQAAYDLEGPAQAQITVALQAYADVQREYPGTRQAAYAEWRGETLRRRLTSGPGPAPRQSLERRSPE